MSSKKQKFVKELICGMSDLHGFLPKVKPCGIVVICGDIFPLSIQHDLSACERWLLNDFKNWAEDLPCKSVVLIAGNHDLYFEKYGKYIAENDEAKISDKIIYLQDSSCYVEGLHIYGCPWCTGPFGWPFCPDEHMPDVNEKYKAIPDCDILLTHQPPKVADLGCSYPGDLYRMKDFGSDRLLNAIYDKKIIANFCGHIHTGQHNGVQYPVIGHDTMYYNVSILDENYAQTYAPTYVSIDIENRTAERLNIYD